MEKNEAIKKAVNGEFTTPNDYYLFASDFATMQNFDRVIKCMRYCVDRIDYVRAAKGEADEIPFTIGVMIRNLDFLYLCCQKYMKNSLAQMKYGVVKATEEHLTTLTKFSYNDSNLQPDTPHADNTNL